MKMLQLPSEKAIHVLGQGTWEMGEDPSKRKDEVGALRLGLDLGMGLIDTAEMYGRGGAEKVVGEAIEGRRDEVFIVTKVYPHNATRTGAVAACERSLKRLKTDYVDLYLLHWIGSVPVSETLEAFQRLKSDGKVLEYGVSNFDKEDLEEAFVLPGGNHIATDQVLYNLKRRGIERNLLPWCRDHEMPIMAYSPIEHGRMLKDKRLRLVASRLGVTPAQVALAWVLSQEGVIAIPKASNPSHVRENRASLDIELTRADLAELDQAFPPPKKKVPLEMI
jgi:diketogulonate reductase-like aldo/keto reductase